MNMNEELELNQSFGEKENFWENPEAALSVRDSLVRVGKGYLEKHLLGDQSDPKLAMFAEELKKAIEAVDEELPEEMKKAGEVSEEVLEEEGLEPIDVLPPFSSNHHPHITTAKRHKQIPFLR